MTATPTLRIAIHSAHFGRCYTRAMQYNSQRRLLVTTLVLAGSLLPGYSVSAEDSVENLVLVTLDGVRWQEIFGGVDLNLIDDERYTDSPDEMKRAFWHERRTERRMKLFPFLWSTIAENGALIGDREQDSYMEVTNSWWFSYPGYNEILTGRADPNIDSNDKNWNANITFLEVLNGLNGFENHVMAFGSWDVFPYIINTQRSEVPVNAGFSTEKNAMTDRTRWLNDVSAEAPVLWKTVRLDFITHGYAMEALKSRKPRVIYISYGETDDFAHDGSYDRYIDAAHRTDRMLSNLWDLLQSDPFYRGNTTLIISTDHGRGNTPDTWRSHASAIGAVELEIENATDGVVGSDEVWLGAIGPSIRSRGLIQGHWTSSQITATVLTGLRLDAETLMPLADEPIEALLH